MESYPQSVERLISEFAKFPGIGKKTAQRMAFHILMSNNEHSAHLAQAVMDVKTKILLCSACGGITEDDPCHICSDPRRDKNLICIVEDPADIYAFERMGIFRGLYHVLGGVISPLDGIGPDSLTIDRLLTRIQEGMEIILATNASIEGDTTALYLGKILNKKGVKVTRLARGIPVGGELEYIDEATLQRAIEGRTQL
ncbi:MAG TPA: recombination protein RecR [Candidatus Marinimicrobia bacterium]|jgi:recombination protein RecR|nr:recombination protein RecR [Candidatus Neomarinimicrobiota bacterium]|tara:strand:- start:5571 stop:6164 length:594 start_codon:yes stop_codon:yes gene_type:complete